MNKLLKAGRFCRVIPASEVLFEVEDTNRSHMVNNKKSYVVNLEDHTCNYGLWQKGFGASLTTTPTPIQPCGAARSADATSSLFKF